jgi:hypothetical protein
MDCGPKRWEMIGTGWGLASVVENIKAMVA